MGQRETAFPWFPVRALSRVFRGKFVAALAAGLKRGDLRLPANRRSEVVLAELTGQDWVVYAKPPFAGPVQVLAYLGRYTHRTAIGNPRLVAMEADQVKFRWRDRAHADKVRVMALPAETFIHRFLLHVLPKGFQRIRHYGLLANRHKAACLAKARAALALPLPAPVVKESVEAFARRVLGVDIRSAARHAGKGGCAGWRRCRDGGRGGRLNMLERGRTGRLAGGSGGRRGVLPIDPGRRICHSRGHQPGVPPLQKASVYPGRGCRHAASFRSPVRPGPIQFAYPRALNPALQSNTSYPSPPGLAPASLQPCARGARDTSQFVSFQNMAHKFSLNSATLLRRFAVYVVVARGENDTKLYVGKTGDNREGCNPIISRCGNHFSYNKIHSQVRNKLTDHESRNYTYVFDHFGEYHKDKKTRQFSIDEINEMERWLNQKIQESIENVNDCSLVNAYSAKGYVSKKEKDKRAKFRNEENKKKIEAIVSGVTEELKANNSLQTGRYAGKPAARPC